MVDWMDPDLFYNCIQFVLSLDGHKRNHFGEKCVTLAGTQSIWLEQEDYRRG